MNTAVNNNKANRNTSVAKGKMSVFRRLMNRGKPEGETGGGAAFGAFSEHYIMTDTVLGTGTYAEVRKARKKGTNEVVAVKIIDKKGLNPRELRGLQKEVNILKSLRHRNVVKFYDSFEQEDTMYVVMEFVAGGELFTKIVSDENGYTEKDVQKIIRTLGEALKHCKDRGVIHRDIKPQNLLLTSPEEGGELKLADFNLSIQLDPEAVSFSVLQTMCGTPNYVAPEILSQKPYDYKCDIWSLGVICYLLLSGGYLPFFVEEEGEVGKDLLLQKVRRGRWSFYPEEAWVNVSPEAKDFLLHVMERVPEKRYDYETLLAHQWLRGTDEKRYSERINVDSVQFSLYKRKLQCATTVYAAVDLFRQIMEEKEKIKDITVGMQSGEEGFENLLDA